MGRNNRKTGRNSAKSNSSFSVLDSECKRIVKEAEHGNCSKAINLVKNLCSNFENTPYEAYTKGVQGNVFMIVASRSNDLKDSKRYYETSIESARRAIDLSPSSIELSLFYASLLYEVANEGWEYEKVMRECERALAVVDVVDPTTGKRPDECDKVKSRVRWAQNQLRFLIRRCNVAMFSTLMRNLGNDEEKFDFKPVREIFDKETIEGQRASTMYLLKQSLVNRPTLVEKKKHGDEMRIVSPDQMMKWVRPCWESMSLDRKKDFLKVTIADLKEHIMSLKDMLPSKVIVEALSFCKEKNEWHFMICCSCNKRISDVQAFRKHIERVHLQAMPLKQLSVIPKYVNDDWVEMICDGSWEPLDLNATVRVLGERPLDFVDKESLLREKWPVAPDSQRAELLGKIQAILNRHVKLQCLCESHIRSISDYAVTTLQNYIQLLRLNVHQTHLCICFLGAQELSNILIVLQEIANSCDLEYSCASSADIDDSDNLAQDAFMGEIGFSQEDSVGVSIYVHSSDNSPETDALLFSMYAKSSNTEELLSCPPFDYLIEEKAQQGLLILQQLEKDFTRLKVSIEVKLNFLGSQDALLVVGKYLCDVVREKIKPETNFQHQTPVFESALRNRKEELIKTGITIFNTFELNAIRDVLDEVESLGSDKIDDSQVREAIQSQGKRFAVKISKMDARIMSIHAKRIHLLEELASVAKHDFRIIATPLLKSFLRSRLEGLQKKAVDELIPKLVSARKKNSKKGKKSQKNSVPEVTNSDNSLDKIIAKEILPPDDHVEDCPSSKVVSSNCVDAVSNTDCHDLQLRDEELKRKLELETEERKLEEALEHQRQMEYEAKQKSIANKHDCCTRAFRQEETEVASEGEQLEHALEDQQQTKDDTLQKHHVESHTEEESLMQNDEFHNISEGAADNTMDGCSVNTGVILTYSKQQPACGKEPSHDSELTTGQIVDIFNFSGDPGVDDDWEVVGKRKKHGKNSTKRRTNCGAKVTNSDNLRDETAEGILFRGEKFTYTEMAPDTGYHNLLLKESERQQSLEYQRHVEHEAKQKTLAKQEEVRSTEIRQVEVEIASAGEQIQKTLEGCCMQNDKFNDASDGAAENITDGCVFSNGSVNRGAISTDNQQQPAREKGPSHGKKDPTSRYDSLADHTTMADGYVKKGKLKWFNNQKAFGFITPEDGTDDLFVHYSSIKSDGLHSLDKGKSVEYQVGVGNHGRPKAINVTGPGGAPVPGFTETSDGNGYGGGYGGRSGGDGRVRCYTCGVSGHMARDCRQRSAGSGYGRRSGSDGCRGQSCGDSGPMSRDCMQHTGGGGSGGGGRYGGQGGIGDGIPLKKRPETGDAGNEAIIKVNGMDVPERGLRIVLVEHNSFPSVIIQSLWHIRCFRDDVKRLSVHAHGDDPFVVCALCDILVAQNAPSVNNEREVYPLTVAIRKTVSYFFNKGPMDDASEVLEIILTHFHQVLMPSEHVSESVESNHHNSSINLFELDITERMTCYHCGLTSRYRKYTSFFRKINANDLGKARLWFPTYSFDELLNLVEINHHLACDQRVFGCGALNHIEHVLTTSPRVFTTFIEWQNNFGSCEDIAQILEAICTSIDVRFLYRGLNTEHRHHLVCMVCYYGQHYCCFGLNEADGKWIIHDDKTIKMVGGWKDVIVMCKAENMKPHVLFYEAKPV